MFNFGIISPKEKHLLKTIEDSNDSDVSLWKVSNILLPICTIVFSIICTVIFKKQDKILLITYLNLLLTGAIPMIALNRISSMGIYLFKYDRSKEKAYGITDTFMLRTKLFLMIFFLVLATMILYIYQVLNYPFKLEWKILTMLILSIIFIILSISISKSIYLLQDKLIDKTFDQEIREDMADNGHGNNW